MAQSGALREAVSGIARDLFATTKGTALVDEWVGFARPLHEDNAYMPEAGYKTETKLVDVPDEEKRSSARERLKGLVQSDASGLVNAAFELENDGFVFELGRIHGTELTPQFIELHGEQGTDISRKVLVTHCDERALPVLWEDVVKGNGFTADDGYPIVADYLDALARLKGDAEFLKQVVEGEIEPPEVLEAARKFLLSRMRILEHSTKTMPTSPKKHVPYPLYFSAEYENLRRLVDPEYWKDGINDLKLLLMFVKQDPEVIQEVFDHPGPEENWKMTKYTSIVLDLRGKKAVQSFMDIMGSDKYPDYLRSHAAVCLRGSEDLDTCQALLNMGGTEPKYVAKAMVNSLEYGRTFSMGLVKPHMPSQILGMFLSHWSEIEPDDFATFMQRSSEIGSEITDLLAARGADSDLKARIVELYRPSRLNPEDMKRIARYCSELGNDTAPFAKLFEWSEWGERIAVMKGFYEVARDPDVETPVRVKAVEVLGDRGGGTILEGTPEFNYLMWAGTPVIGYFWEPNRQVRKAVRKAYATFTS